MSKKPRIVAFGGSLRAESFNQKIVTIAAEGAREAGAEVTVVALRDYELPIFSEDYEAVHGMPEGVKAFKKLLRESDGFLIASPEYNSSVTAALKNAIDWASRVESDDEPMLSAFTGKTAALCAASPGGLGGLRGLVHLRAILGNIGVIVLPTQVAVPSVHNSLDERQERKLRDLGADLAKHLEKHIA